MSRKRRWREAGGAGELVGLALTLPVPLLIARKSLDSADRILGTGLGLLLASVLAFASCWFFLRPLLRKRLWLRPRAWSDAALFLALFPVFYAGLVALTGRLPTRYGPSLEAPPGSVFRILSIALVLLGISALTRLMALVVDRLGARANVSQPDVLE